MKRTILLFNVVKLLQVSLHKEKAVFCLSAKVRKAEEKQDNLSLASSQELEMNLHLGVHRYELSVMAAEEIEFGGVQKAIINLVPVP